MMESSDRAYVVLDGERQNRSLQPFMRSSVDSRRRSLYQIDLAKTHPCLFHDGIRVGTLDGLLQELTDGTIHAAVNVSSFSRAAAILAEQTRRADLSPPSLQAVHEQVGRLLADALLDEYSFDETMVEEAHFDHVQGSHFTCRVAKSSDIAILSLMRGGDPMARGVFARLPSASYVHYWNDDQPLDFDMDRPCPVRRIYVVDSVINRGDSIRRVLTRLEGAMSSTGQSRRWAVYVLSGVMHEAASISLPREFPRVRFVTLRVSANQYTGTGGTDTGNRLFGTYH
jgi:uracil phosphoribosyltransferase